MEVAELSEMAAYFYQTVWHHIHKVSTLAYGDNIEDCLEVYHVL
jgi:hypothetical protein